ncbi:MAG: hypothetical protein ACFB0B_04350 [Thermonemataceae bacterium]
MSDKHKNARKWLTINTALFIGVAIYFVGFFTTNMYQSFTEQYTTLKLIATIGSLGLFLWFGVRNFFGAWKAFSNLKYSATMVKGVTAWLSGILLFVVDLIF